MDLGTLVAKIKVDDSDFDQKTSGWSTKGAAVGSAFGNVAADAISEATSMLVDFVGEAANASDATDKFQKTLEFAGLDTSTIDAYLASTQAYADSTVYSLTDIQSITAQLASNGIEGPDKLAESLGNLNAIAGGNAETFGRVGSVLTQTAGQGKLTTENWNQLADAIPGASGKLQDALLQAGAYTGNFREAMEKGEITAEEFNAAISLVGSDPIAVEAAKSVSTFEGATGNAAAAVQSKLVAALDVLKPGLTAIVNGIADFITNIESWTPVLAGIGAVLLAVLAPAIMAAVIATWAWTAALLANPITWIILAIGLLVAGIVWLIMNWDTAVAFITEIWGGFITWITGVIDGFMGWWGPVWDGIASFFTGVWDGIVAFAMAVWQFYIGWLIDIIVFLVQNWDQIWNRVGQIIRDVWNAIVNWLTGIIVQIIFWAIGQFNGFVSFWSGLWNNVRSTIVDIWNGILSWFGGIPGAIMAVFSGAGQWLYSIGRDIINGLWNGLKSIAGAITGWFESTFGGIIDTVAGLFGIASPSRVFRQFGQFIGQGLIEGLEEFQDPIDAEFKRMTEVPPIDVPPPPPGNGWDPSIYEGRGDTKIVNLTQPAGTSTEEQIFAALGSPRVGD
jgi:tape measure domain-containing protein